MIAVTTYATQAYAYSVRAMARHVAAAVEHHREGVLIFAGDQSKAIAEAYEYFKGLLPGWKHQLIAMNLDDDNERYKLDAQMVISRLQTAAFQAARQAGADMCWSVEADILPPPNALRCCEDMLRFDGGYYDVSMVTYPNDAFLGGRGTPQNPICQSYDVLEKYIEPELKRQFAQYLAEQSVIQKSGKPPTKEWLAAETALHEKLQQCPPMLNIWQSNAEFGWRKRGWLNDAYPAIGKGAAMPTDWVGLGCTLLSKKALSLTHFEGYEAKGTQDLFLCWHRWYPAGLKLCVITHTLCDHIKRDRANPKNIVHLKAYHETEGEYEGHIRLRVLPWVDHGAPKGSR